MSGSLGKVPLERALSKLGVASRRQTQEWIVAGKITVNGRVIKDRFCPVTPETDTIEVDGKSAVRPTAQTVLFYKPKGCVTTRSDDKGRPTVFDLLPPEMKALHPVGPLDAGSAGLLLLTSDTRLSDFLSDPINGVPRTYVVTIEGQLVPGELADIEQGMMDEGEVLRPSKIVEKKASPKESHFLVELIEGNSRGIRRMFSFFGHRVRKLKRIALGPFELGDLEPGKFRSLTPEETAALAGLRRKDEIF